MYYDIFIGDDNEVGEVNALNTIYFSLLTGELSPVFVFGRSAVENLVISTFGFGV